MRESSEMRKDPPVVESRASRQTSPRPHRRRLYASDDGRDPASKVASEVRGVGVLVLGSYSAFSCRLSPPMTTAHFLTAPNRPQPLGMPPRIAQAHPAVERKFSPDRPFFR